jgi:Tol biopolymer transport system component
MLVVLEARPAEATFPGKNGKIAYSAPDDGVIYTIYPDGGGKGKVTEGSDPSYSPDGKKVAYSGYDDRTEETELYTVRATVGRPSTSPTTIRPIPILPGGVVRSGLLRIAA